MATRRSALIGCGTLLIFNSQSASCTPGRSKGLSVGSPRWTASDEDDDGSSSSENLLPYLIIFVFFPIILMLVCICAKFAARWFSRKITAQAIRQHHLRRSLLLSHSDSAQRRLVSDSGISGISPESDFSLEQPVHTIRIESAATTEIGACQLPVAENSAVTVAGTNRAGSLPSLWEEDPPPRYLEEEPPPAYEVLFDEKKA